MCRVSGTPTGRCLAGADPDKRENRPDDEPPCPPYLAGTSACRRRSLYTYLIYLQASLLRRAGTAAVWNGEMMRTDTTRDHAVVLGASMAGLLAARVLSEFYRTVTVVDRDLMPAIGQHRRGVPQGRHLHALLARGAIVLEELFPGLRAELAERGAVLGDVSGNGRWMLSGHRFCQQNSGLVAILASRPFLEGHVREAVMGLPNVVLVDGHDVCDLTATADRRRVTGVRMARHNGVAPAEVLPADLVVDATGRGSRTPTWLRQLGYPAPREDRVEIGLKYVSRVYRLRSGALGSDKGIVTAATPDHPRGGVLAALEGGRHLVSLFGMHGDHPPTDPAGFEAFAAELLFPDIVEALQGAEPIGDPVAFRVPVSVRRRYERVTDFPQRLLVLGDAMCAFDPVYGQGMTVAALEAVGLRRLLGRGGAPDARRYFRDIARIVDSPWTIAVGGDLAFPQVSGRRTAKVWMVNAYLARLHAAAAVDPTLAVAFLRVAGLIDRPESLLRPDRVARVLYAQRTTPRRLPASRAGAPDRAIKV
jgi:2-polyprenyl-6-methoxyphenol hydroxylase-like FAD-dependent oxidoreductase